MDCRYNKYFNDLLYGNIKEEKKLELIKHAEQCSECTGKLREIEEIDSMIKDVMGYSTYEDFRYRTIKAVEERKDPIYIRRVIYKYVCVMAAVFVVIILAYSSGFLANMNKSTDNSDLGLGSNSKVMYDKVYKFDPPLTKTYDGMVVKVKELEVLPHQVIATLTGGSNNLLGFEVYDDQGNHIYSRASSLNSASEDPYYSLTFEMFTLKSRYITLRPYCGYEPVSIVPPKEFPAVLTSGRGLVWVTGRENDDNKETLTLTGIDYLPDKTVLHFEHEGYGIARCSGIEDVEGKFYNSILYNEKIISTQAEKETYIQEYPLLPRDSIKKITFYRIINVPEMAEQLEIKIPIGDDIGF